MAAIVLQFSPPPAVVAATPNTILLRDGAGAGNLTALIFPAAATPTISQTQTGVGVGATSTWYAQQGRAGSVGGILKIGGGLGGTPGTQLSGDTQIDLGAAVSNVSAKFSILTNGTGGGLDIQQTGVNTVRILAGSTLVLAGPGSVEIDCSGAAQASFGNGTMTWAVANPTPTYSQSDVATGSATGQTMSFVAQNATGVTSIGGGLLLKSGNGTTRGGDVSIVPGAVGSQGNISLFSAAGGFGGGQGVAAIANATTAPTTGPSSGCILYSNSGGLTAVPANAGGTAPASPYSCQLVPLGDGTNPPTKAADTIYRAAIAVSSNVLTQIIAIPIPAQSMMAFSIMMQAICTVAGGTTTQDQGLSLVRQVTAARVGAAAPTLVGTTNTIGTDNNNTTGIVAPSSALSIDISGNTLRIRVASANAGGTAQGTIVWSVLVDASSITR